MGLLLWHIMNCNDSLRGGSDPWSRVCSPSLLAHKYIRSLRMGCYVRAYQRERDNYAEKGEIPFLHVRAYHAHVAMGVVVSNGAEMGGFDCCLDYSIGG